MNKPRMLYIDQYGNIFWASTVAELRQQIGNGRSRVEKMYADGKGGKTYHVGYIIGDHWLNAYTPYSAEQ